MLIILHCLPVAAPSESIFAEEAVAEVAPGYLVFKLAVAVEIGSAGSGFDDGFASRGVGFASTQCLCVSVFNNKESFEKMSDFSLWIRKKGVTLQIKKYRI